MTSAAAVEVRDLTRSYGERKALGGISFDVPEGEIFALLGPNGGGKTTLLRILSTLLPPSAGRAAVFGLDVVRDYREARKKIGLSPQEFNMDFFRTVYKTLDFVGGYFGMRKPEREKRMEYLFSELGLRPYKNTQFRALSGGFKRRVMLARAMMHDPEILILDEPTAGVDVELRRDLWRILTELNRKGKTIFLTTHYLEEAQRLCDRIGIIFNGKIVALESKAELVKDGKSVEDHYLHYAELERDGVV